MKRYFLLSNRFSRGDRTCPEHALDHSRCLRLQDCPVDSQWSVWSSLSGCSVTCGRGLKSKSHVCYNYKPVFGSLNCISQGNEASQCNTSACPVIGHWSRWNSWSSCSVTCGTGTKTRTRACKHLKHTHGSISCTGQGTNSVNCHQVECPIDGHWSQWAPYSSCSVTCGMGIQSITRNCDNPAPAHGGKQFVGTAVHIKTCVVSKACPVNGGWSAWAGWSGCSFTCGIGTRTRTRNCNHPDHTSGWHTCKGQRNESSTCGVTNCPVNGHWSSWSWSECSVTCGIGTRFRGRTCNNPTPAYGGHNCVGLDRHGSRHKCSLQDCSTDGQWSLWSKWSDCSHSCGGGVTTRNRVCNIHGRKFCTGNGTDTRSCNNTLCSIDGAWSAWQNWEACSTSCGGGVTVRLRVCDNPAPQGGGNSCVGSHIESNICNNVACLVNGDWSTWGAWIPCTVSCERGLQTRARSCYNPLSANGGSKCSGDGTSSRECNTQQCPTQTSPTKWVTIHW